GFAGTAIAAVDVHYSPFGIARPGRWVKDHVAERMNPGIQLDSHQLASCSLEHVIRCVRVRPLDQHSFIHGRSRSGDRRSCGVTRSLETWKIRVVRPVRSRKRRVFDVDSVKLSVSAIIRIEIYGAQTTPVSGFKKQLVKQTGAAFATIEIEIGFGLLC